GKFLLQYREWPLVDTSGLTRRCSRVRGLVCRPTIMKKKASRSRGADAGSTQEGCCALCRLSDDDPFMFGEKVSLKDEKLSVHYFCLLTSCGVYQRGHEDEGVFGFLLEDIRQERRRSARLTCSCCKKKGACVY
ncbi:G2/M phase-specific E3 ubiquitin-protein ligase-like, partial [Etheostoma cragini]|uniref:G2/M phase-specific E3 ubiquitin-protein ligase-like n=1 Tax=Etheostoma cragini TaxID=417921 RepID=UPI00155EA044